MALTIGAIILLIGLIFLIYYGYSVGVKRTSRPGEEHLVRCTLCQRRFDPSRLVERQVGDSKLYYFCEECVEGLHQATQKRKGPLG